MWKKRENVLLEKIQCNLFEIFSSEVLTKQPLKMSQY